MQRLFQPRSYRGNCKRGSDHQCGHGRFQSQTQAIPQSDLATWSCAQESKRQRSLAQPQAHVRCQDDDEGVADEMTAFLEALGGEYAHCNIAREFDGEQNPYDKANSFSFSCVFRVSKKALAYARCKLHSG